MGVKKTRPTTEEDDRGNEAQGRRKWIPAMERPMGPFRRVGSDNAIAKVGTMTGQQSLYRIGYCDRCGAPLSAHAMAVLREDMPCLACLLAESAVIAALRGSGQTPVFADDLAAEPQAGLGAAQPAGE